MRLALICLLIAAAVGCATQRAATADTAGMPPTVRPAPSEERAAPARAAEAAEAGPLAPEVIYYQLDSSLLRPESRDVLDRLADALRRRRNAKVTIAGHTCDLGTTEYNIALGQQRAKAARDYLVRLGVESARVRTVSFGEELPAAANDDEERRSRNRRSELSSTEGQARVD